MLETYPNQLEMLQLREQGWSYEQLKAKFGWWKAELVMVREEAQRKPPPAKNMVSQKEEIIQLHQQGKNTEEIANQTGYHPMSVLRITRKLRGSSRTKLKHAEIIQGYERGQSLDELAAQFNIHRESVRRIVKGRRNK